MDGFLESEKHTDLHTTQVQQHNGPPRVRASIPGEKANEVNSACIPSKQNQWHYPKEGRRARHPPLRYLAWVIPRWMEKSHEDQNHSRDVDPR